MLGLPYPMLTTCSTSVAGLSAAGISAADINLESKMSEAQRGQCSHCSTVWVLIPWYAYHICGKRRHGLQR